MSQFGLTGKCRLIAGAAMVLSFAAAPVHAHVQGAPPGSYLRTCTHVATRGDTLVADCRRTDGRTSRNGASGAFPRHAGPPLGAAANFRGPQPHFLADR